MVVKNESYDELIERIKDLPRDEQIKQLEKSIFLNDAIVRSLRVYLKEMKKNGC